MGILPKKKRSSSETQSSSAGQGGKQKKTRKQWVSKVGTVLATIVMVGIITASVMASVAAVYIFKYMETEPNVDLNELPFNYTTILYANDSSSGEPVEIQRLHENENRIWVDIDQVPEYLPKVAIAAEDKRFEQHNGVDWKRTIFATFKFFTDPNATQGGSTITQQVIKNVTGDKQFSWQRKVREIFSALRLSKEYTKEQVMEAYLNTIALGHNTNGVQAAANLYFNKDVSELSLPECCALIAITQNPTRFDLLTEKGYANNKLRRDYIFGEMKDAKMITEEEYNEYINTEIEVYHKDSSSDSQEQTSSYQSWFVDNVEEEVIADLMEEYNYDHDEAENMLLNGGLRIYTTMDKGVQSSLESSYNNNANFPRLNNKTYPETAFVVIRPDGSIAGLMGGNNKTTDRGFNRATMSKLQPGSTIKPISAYLQAFEMDLLTWSTIVTDQPIQIMQDGKMTDWPINYYSGYKGPMRVVEALQRSTNTIPAQLVEEIGPQRCYDFLVNKLKFSHLIEGADNIHLSSMALGGLTGGVTPLEMVGAYQIFVTGGKYVKPYSYTKVLDSNGNLVLEKDTTQVRVISAETATVINRLLQMVTTQAPGTGTAANLGGGIPVAGKTGSTSDNKDLWFIGATPYYIGGVWMGYDKPATIYYNAYPTPILWKNIMSPILRGLPAKNFEYSSSVVSREYCMETGDLATANCPSKGTGWYKEDNIPSECYKHSMGGGTVDENSGDENNDENNYDFPDDENNDDEE